MYIFYTELNPCSFHGVCRKKKFIALCSSSVECVWLPHWHIHNIQNTHTRNTNERCTVHTEKQRSFLMSWWMMMMCRIFYCEGAMIYLDAAFALFRKRNVCVCVKGWRSKTKCILHSCFFVSIFMLWFGFVWKGEIHKY